MFLVVSESCQLFFTLRGGSDFAYALVDPRFGILHVISHAARLTPQGGDELKLGLQLGVLFVRGDGGIAQFGTNALVICLRIVRLLGEMTMSFVRVREAVCESGGVLVALLLCMLEGLNPKSQPSPEVHCLVGTVNRFMVIRESLGSVVSRLLMHRSGTIIRCLGNLTDVRDLLRAGALHTPRLPKLECHEIKLRLHGVGSTARTASFLGRLPHSAARSRA
jgi:hypothetical protein